MDTVGASVTGQIPALENMPPHNEDGAGGEHVYAPWWLYKEQKAGKLDFARGYHIEIGAGRDMPSFGAASGLANHVGGYGKQFKAGHAALLRLVRQPGLSRRDDSQRGLVLRDRSAEERSVRHSDAALPLEVVRARETPGASFAQGVLPRSSRTWAAA